MGPRQDSVIESLAASAREAGESVEVVTSDGATRRTAAGGSVVVTRATTFARELDGDESVVASASPVRTAVARPWPTRFPLTCARARPPGGAANGPASGEPLPP